MTPHPPGQEADLGLDRDASEAASPACHSSDSDMVLVSVSASQSPSTDPFSDGQAPVDTWRATSPALSSSSHTPSSCTLDDAAALSDVSSLDGHDFEMVHNRSPPSVPMPLSRPASMHSASSGADDSASEQSWPEERQAALVGPLPAEQLRGDIDDAAALNSSLGSAYELFCMHNSSASSSLMTPRSSFQRIPQSRACHRTAATIVQHAQTYPSASLTTLARSSTSPRPAPASDFEFPDPMGESFKFMQHQRESDDALVADNEGSIVQDEASALTTDGTDPPHVISSHYPASADVGRMAEPALSAGSDVNGQSEGVGTHTPSDFSFLSDGTRSSSQSAMFLLRNPWVPAPSSGSKSIINSPSHRTLSEVPTHPSASPAAFNVSTLDGSWPTSTSADPPVGSADHAVRPHPAAASQSESGRLGKRKCLSFPALANVFYLGRRPGSQVAWHVSQTIRASLCEALGHSAGGSPFLETPEGHTGQVSVRRSRAFISQTKVLDLREFDCTEALGAYGESARIEHWLESRGGDEVFRNGALVVCYIENGDTPTSLAQHLATLLGRLHSRVRAANDASKPLVLPVLCPRPPNNLDDGDSITSGSQVDQVHELTRQFDLRQAEREWSAVIADTLISLRQRHSVQKLHADFAPGLALTGVIAFEQLLSSASAWFDHNVAWAAQVAVPLDAARIASTPSKLPRTPAWLAKTAAWLKVTAPVISAPSTLDTEMQITLWEEHQLPPATSSVKSLRHLRSVGRYTLGAIFLGVLWAFLSTFPALESLMRFQGSPALISSRPACVHLNSFPTMTHSGFSSPFHYSWPTHPPRELATVPANRSSDLALYHYFDLATLSSPDWLSVPVTTAAAVNAYRSKDEVADQVLNLSTQLLSHAVIGATAVLSTLQREWSFWLAEILDFYAHIVQPSAQFIALELMTAAHNAQSMIDGACVFVRGRVAPVAARARQTFALCDDSAYSQTVCQSAVGAHALRRSIDGLRKQTLGLQLFADAALVRGKRHVAQSGRHFAEKVTSLRDGLTSVQKNIWSRYDSLGDALEVVFQPDEL